MKLLKSNWLIGLYGIPLITDVLFTVLGQPKLYWLTHYKVVDEAAPVQFLLHLGPIIFIAAGFLVWLPITYLLTKKLPKPINLWAAMALFLGHGYNSIAWLRHIQVDRSLLNDQTVTLIPMTIYIFLVSYIAMIFLRKYFKET